MKQRQELVVQIYMQRLLGRYFDVMLYYSPSHFRLRFDKNQEMWYNEKEIASSVPNHNDEVNLMYITRLNGNIYCLDLIDIIPILQEEAPGKNAKLYKI
jgi:hypothetical protein